jgi:diguanylate cyclase
VTNSENSSGSILEWLGFRGAREGRSAAESSVRKRAGNVFQAPPSAR